MPLNASSGLAPGQGLSPHVGLSGGPGLTMSFGPIGDALLLEDGFFFKLEDDCFLLLE